jgi:uncharacterized protein YqhQ
MLLKRYCISGPNRKDVIENGNNYTERNFECALFIIIIIIVIIIIIRTIKSTKMKWARYVARVAEMYSS